MLQIATDYSSPDVKADGRVIFRLYAPGAQNVVTVGAWDNWQRHKMTRESGGLWTVTIGPLANDIYEYKFTVDGLDILDPKNGEFRPMTNRVEVNRGRKDLVWQPQNVPHGSITVMPYDSKSAGIQRRAHIYTPPGYEENRRERYPVLYLLHGSGDNDSHWSSGLGRANVVIDNLIAQGKVPPMIVVMPHGHIYYQGKPTPQDAIERDIVEDLLPLVDKRFRTSKRRAMCGLSMGGGQTVTIGMKHPELFSAFGIFSAGIFNGPQFETAISTFEKSVRNPAKQPLVWVAIGKDDFLMRQYGELKTRLNRNLKATYVETEGGHVWHLWRQYLADFAPLAFK